MRRDLAVSSRGDADDRSASSACKAYRATLLGQLNAALFGAFVVHSDLVTVRLRSRDSLIQACLGAVSYVPVPFAEVVGAAASYAYYLYGSSRLVR